MSYSGIIFLTLSALIAIGNLCSSMEIWMRRRKGIKIRYTNVPFASLLCGLLAWINARGLVGSWAFLPALVDPGSWLIFGLAWKTWARSGSAGSHPDKSSVQKKDL